MERLTGLFAALFQDTQKAGPLKEVAKHLARVALYQKFGTDALYPDVKEKCEKLISVMASKGMPVRLQEGFRPAKLQDEYYAKGRTTTGSKITNAKGLQSYHQYGLAFDLVFVEHGYNPPDSWWDILGKEGEKLGLSWGGRWIGFSDRPHFEWHPGFEWKELEQYFK